MPGLFELKGAHAYLANSSKGVLVADLRDPARPLPRWEHPTSYARRIHVAGGRIYAADRNDGPSSANGAAAPNNTASQLRVFTRSCARRRTTGVGSSIEVFSRTTSKGCSRSNASHPFHREV